jgi:hypothetical protein
MGARPAPKRLVARRSRAHPITQGLPNSSTTGRSWRDERGPDQLTVAWDTASDMKPCPTAIVGDVLVTEGNRDSDPRLLFGRNVRHVDDREGKVAAANPIRTICTPGWTKGRSHSGSTPRLLGANQLPVHVSLDFALMTESTIHAGPLWSDVATTSGAQRVDRNDLGDYTGSSSSNSISRTFGRLRHHGVVPRRAGARRTLVPQ